jgi:aminoglycoside phosphotransferase (APT) family kinase protein
MRYSARAAYRSECSRTKSSGGFRRRRGNTTKPAPPAEINIDSSLVRALLEEQHPDLAVLDLVAVGEGWDNVVFRLGKELAVRIPRRAASAGLIEQEQRWLPELSTRLPLPIPAPVRVGRPGCGFPWSWSVVPWCPGQSALLTPSDPIVTAATLGHFLQQLHQPAPQDAPYNLWRSIPLADRDHGDREHSQQLAEIVERDSILRLWDRAVSAPSWLGPPVWIHGDLHPGNLLIEDGRLSAVIDFGDLAAGDPATDLSIMWMLFPSSARSVFVNSARGRFNPLNNDTIMRAHGWAIALGLSWLASSRNDVVMQHVGRKAIDGVLNE